MITYSVIPIIALICLNIISLSYKSLQENYFTLSVFLHSYKNPRHEKIAHNIIKKNFDDNFFDDDRDDWS